jgi:hypothetical protein
MGASPTRPGSIVNKEYRGLFLPGAGSTSTAGSGSRSASPKRQTAAAGCGRSQMKGAAGRPLHLHRRSPGFIGEFARAGPLVSGKRTSKPPYSPRIFVVFIRQFAYATRPRYPFCYHSLRFQPPYHRSALAPRAAPDRHRNPCRRMAYRSPPVVPLPRIVTDPARICPLE